MDEQAETNLNNNNPPTESSVLSTAPPQRVGISKWVYIIMLAILIIAAVGSYFIFKSNQPKPKTVNISSNEMPVNFPPKLIISEPHSRVLLNYNNISATSTSGTRMYTSNIVVSDNYNHFKAFLSHDGWVITEKLSGQSKIFEAYSKTDNKLNARVEVDPALPGQDAVSTVTITITEVK